eukprot:TRINITY_DN38388_c0_g1_i1.p1 TRINITY_DN38388_c0_g1~~TRINITY_DN38388_c0_g1_i1.p1  ORF type:complete len:858 (+),score=203.05 TRINITY_DN38388_c0_g1_i1:96-2669(+)
MAAPDSWEDMDDSGIPGQRGAPNNYQNSHNHPNHANARLNANAPTFAFNPSAATFTPPGYGNPNPQQAYYGAPMQYVPQNPYGGGYQNAGYQVQGGQYGQYMPPGAGYGAGPMGMQPGQQHQQNMQGYGQNPRGMPSQQQGVMQSGPGGRGRGQQQQQQGNRQGHQARGDGSSNHVQQRGQYEQRGGSQQGTSQARSSGPSPQNQQHGGREGVFNGGGRGTDRQRNQAAGSAAAPRGTTGAVPAPVAAAAPAPVAVPSPPPPPEASPVLTAPVAPAVPEVPAAAQVESAPPEVEEKEEDWEAKEEEEVKAEAAVVDSKEAAAVDEVADQLASVELKAEESAESTGADRPEEVARLPVGAASVLRAQEEEPVKPPVTGTDAAAPADEHDEEDDHELGGAAAKEEHRPPVEEKDETEDGRDHLNLVFIGHVDAGKSTIGGQILFLSGMVDKRTIEKFEREAKDKNRESWYMAYIMDTNEEERAKGKTVEVGRAHFETEKRRYTVLDAPGHKNYVPNMISGASQADVGVLVIAARKGEFETGFERGGQTREHAQLAKTLGVSKLVVVVNKMDDPSVEWSKERFDEIVSKMNPFLKTCGYNTKKDVQFLPISGLMGTNMKERMPTSVCPWYNSGPCFFEILDALELPQRDPNGPFRMPLIDKFRDMGTVVMGKIESGSVRRGDNLVVMPNRVPVKVVTLLCDADEVNRARPGENLRIRLSGIEEEDILPGFVLSSVANPISGTLVFDAQLQILELLDHKTIFTAGYKAVLHIHSIVEECEIIELLTETDRKTLKQKKRKPLFVKSGAILTCRVQVGQLICVEEFKAFPQLGRFTLRDEGKTIAIGKVLALNTSAPVVAPAE